MDDECRDLNPSQPRLTARQKFWFDHILACEASGNSATQYAKDHDLPVTSLYQRKKEFRKRGLLPPRSLQATSFAKVHRTLDGSYANALRICFPNGIRIEWPMPRDDESATHILQRVARLC